MGLVSGYGSDSGSDLDEEHVSTPATASSSSSSLKPSAKPTGLSSLLPPPKSNSSNGAPVVKRKKRQIKVGSLSDDDDNDVSDGESLSSSKKPKITSTAASSSSSHSLFGMLPAPSRDPPPPKAKGQAAMTRAADEGDGDDIDSESQVTMSIQENEDAEGKKKPKGNADFRAMLGLKPVEKKGGSSSSASGSSTRIEAKPHPLASQSASTLKKQTSLVPEAAASIPPLASTSAKPASPPPATETVDFFSIGSDHRGQSSTHRSSSAAQFSTSSAPTIVEDNPYPGWHQNPDGSWVPVTPEAQEAYAKHQAAQESSQEAERARMIERLREQDGIDVDSLQHVDLDATRAAWEKRPMEARGSSSAALDAKYAQAAGILPADAAAEKKDSKDKKTNFRAKQKGQLTSLFAQADERRDELEEKWAAGKQNRKTAASRYGF